MIGLRARSHGPARGLRRGFQILDTSLLTESGQVAEPLVVMDLDDPPMSVPSAEGRLLVGVATGPLSAAAAALLGDLDLTLVPGAPEDAGATRGAGATDGAAVPREVVAVRDPGARRGSYGRYRAVPAGCPGPGAGAAGERRAAGGGGAGRGVVRVLDAAGRGRVPGVAGRPWRPPAAAHGRGPGADRPGRGRAAGDAEPAAAAQRLRQAVAGRAGRRATSGAARPVARARGARRGRVVLLLGRGPGRVRDGARPGHRASSCGPSRGPGWLVHALCARLGSKWRCTFRAVRGRGGEIPAFAGRVSPLPGPRSRCRRWPWAEYPARAVR